MRNDDLAISLDEFGLSKYESKAYLVLLSKGPLSASELAYYANLPRTKVYPTLTKLAKKKLAVITQDKPVVCSAVSPDDALGELVLAQESRAKGMKNIVEKLQKISCEGRKPQGAEERTYLVLEPNLVLGTLEELISATKSIIASTLDSWGLRLLLQCRNSLAKAITNYIEVKIVVSKECSNDLLSSLPNGVNVKIGEPNTDILIFDKFTVMLVNGSNGKGVLFRSNDVMWNICNRMLDKAWSNSKDLIQVRLAKNVTQP